MVTIDRDGAYIALVDFLGTVIPKLMYAGYDGELRSTNRPIPAAWEGSTPGIPQTNSRIERTVQDTLDGCMVCLHQAGLPNCVWPYAIQAYRMHENLSGKTPNETPWYKRFERHSRQAVLV